MDNSSRFFQNSDCEFFPCHEMEHEEEFNCMFCFCPLYALGSDCGGDFGYTDDGIKDCSGCRIPHRKDGYDHIVKQYDKIKELTEKRK